MATQTSVTNKVQEIFSDQEFEDKVKASKGLVVVDFYGDWCRACKIMAPIFDQIAAQYPNVKFFKVNADRQECSSCSSTIQALPTFRFFKDGEYKSQVGPNKDYILENIKNLS